MVEIWGGKSAQGERYRKRGKIGTLGSSKEERREGTRTKNSGRKASEIS